MKNLIKTLVQQFPTISVEYRGGQLRKSLSPVLLYFPCQSALHLLENCLKDKVLVFPSFLKEIKPLCSGLTEALMLRYIPSGFPYNGLMWLIEAKDIRITVVNSVPGCPFFCVGFFAFFLLRQFGVEWLAVFLPPECRRSSAIFVPLISAQIKNTKNTFSLKKNSPRIFKENM